MTSVGGGGPASAVGENAQGEQSPWRVWRLFKRLKPEPPGSPAPGRTREHTDSRLPRGSPQRRSQQASRGDSGTAVEEARQRWGARPRREGDDALRSSTDAPRGRPCGKTDAARPPSPADSRRDTSRLTSELTSTLTAHTPSGGCRGGRRGEAQEPGGADATHTQGAAAPPWWHSDRFHGGQLSTDRAGVVVAPAAARAAGGASRLACSAPAVWPVPNGQPQAGDPTPRADKRRVPLCGTRASPQPATDATEGRRARTCRRSTAPQRGPRRPGCGGNSYATVPVGGFHTQGQESWARPSRET